MPKGVLVVETASSSPDRDAEFNDFYNNTHLAEVLRVPSLLLGTAPTSTDLPVGLGRAG